MSKALSFICLVLFIGFAACSKQPAVAQPETAPVTTNAQPTPSAVPSVSPMIVAPALVMPPAVPNPKDGKQAKVDQKPLPPDLWQRMTRPLTLEEINKLPPETRDMILRAQGRLPASPTPQKK